MTQITFTLALGAVATTMGLTPTTSGPIKIPSWAPDISSISTTTVDDHSAMILATTGRSGVQLRPGSGYNTRCFCLKTGRILITNDTVTLNYTAVGELVRT